LVSKFTSSRTAGLPQPIAIMQERGLVRAYSLPDISEEVVPGTEALGTEAPGTVEPGTEGPVTEVPYREATDAVRTIFLRGNARWQTIESECAWYQESQEGVFYQLEDNRKLGAEGARIKSKKISL
jgi:hypothetical protein